MADSTAYCTVADLRKGDIPLARHMGDGQQYVDRAAEEIDAAIGHIYITPIEFDLAAHPEQRPAFLLLKKVNWLLASGRLVLDLAATGEDADLHAYGRSMLQEGIALLTNLTNSEILLTGADKIPVPVGEQGRSSGPQIINEDDVSLVQSFYDRFNPTPGVPGTVYGGVVR